MLYKGTSIPIYVQTIGNWLIFLVNYSQRLNSQNDNRQPTSRLSARGTYQKRLTITAADEAKAKSHSQDSEIAAPPNSSFN
jgi:hypothetical protein